MTVPSSPMIVRNYIICSVWSGQQLYATFCPTTEVPVTYMSAVHGVATTNGPNVVSHRFSSVATRFVSHKTSKHTYKTHATAESRCTPRAGMFEQLNSGRLCMVAALSSSALQNAAARPNRQRLQFPGISQVSPVETMNTCDCRP